MKKKTLVRVLIISLLLISSCAYIGEICSQFLPEEFCRIITCVFGEEGVQNMLNNQEVRQFLQTHPDAEITMTLIPRKNILKNYNTLSNELGTRLQIKDYIKLELKDSDDVLTVLVDANSKSLNYVKVGIEKPSEIEKPKTPQPAEAVAKPAISKPPITPTTQCYKDIDCADIITYSCNFQGNPIRVKKDYKCENNKCKLSVTQQTTLDICKDNESCKEGVKTCLPKKDTRNIGTLTIVEVK